MKLAAAQSLPNDPILKCGSTGIEKPTKRTQNSHSRSYIAPLIALIEWTISLVLIIISNENNKKFTSIGNYMTL